MQIVYIIQQDISGRLYIGTTTNLEQRLQAHNSNMNKSTNRKVGTWILVYAEAYRSRADAIMREKMLKQHGSSKKELLKRIKQSLLEIKSEAG